MARTCSGVCVDQGLSCGKRAVRVVAGWLSVWCVNGLAHAGALQHYWTFDDGSGVTAANAVAGGTPGALVNFNGNEGWTSEKPAELAHSTGSLLFSAASSQYVDCGALGLSSVASNEGATVSFWVKPRTIADFARLFAQFGPLGDPPQPYANGGMAMQRINDEVGTLFGWDTALNPPIGDWRQFAPGCGLYTNQWQHMAFVWRGTSVVAYRNGQPLGYINMQFDFNRDANNNVLKFGIGAKFYLQYGEWLDGLIDDFAVWSEALTTDQVRSLTAGASPLTITSGLAPKAPDRPLAEYRLDGNALDSRLLNHGYTEGNTAFVSGEGNTPFAYAGNSAVQVSGGGVTIPDAPAVRPGTNAWSISVWFKAGAFDQQGTVIAKRMSDYPVTQINLLVAGGDPYGNPGDGRRVHLYNIAPPDLNNWFEVSTISDIADGQWHHLALVMAAGVNRPVLYIDGTVAPVYILNDAGVHPFDNTNYSPWTIGHNGAGSYYYGLVDEVGLWDRALTGDNIAWLASHSLEAIPPKGTVMALR